MNWVSSHCCELMWSFISLITDEIMCLLVSRRDPGRVHSAAIVTNPLCPFDIQRLKKKLAPVLWLCCWPSAGWQDGMQRDLNCCFWNLCVIWGIFWKLSCWWCRELCGRHSPNSRWMTRSSFTDVDSVFPFFVVVVIFIPSSLPPVSAARNLIIL